MLAPIHERKPAALLSGFFTQIYAVADAEIRKLRHDPTELLTRAFQPAIWLLLFGQVMAHVRGLASDGGKYLDFLAPGILAQSVLFAAIFYGIAAIWERVVLSLSTDTNALTASDARLMFNAFSQPSVLCPLFLPLSRSYERH